MTAEKKDIENAIAGEIAMILGIDPGDVAPDTPLESLGMDSIRLVEVLIFIEKQYGIRLMDVGFDRDSLRNAASLASCVAEALQSSDG